MTHDKHLLKDRVSDIDTLRDALNWLSLGEGVSDPAIVAGLMSKRRPRACWTSSARESARYLSSSPKAGPTGPSRIV
jgi:hypothetical protein